MTLVEKIRSLANKKNMSLPQLEVELGLGNGTISRWRTSSPNTEKLQRIADYFNVSIDWLLGREITLNTRDMRDIKNDIDSLKEKMLNKEIGPAAYDGEDLSDESVELFLGELEIALKRLKLINKEKYNPNKNKDKK